LNQPARDRTVQDVLVIAYYFPPMGLSGVQRVSKLVKYLPEAGWRPTVLTVEPGGYYAFDESLLKDIENSDITVIRTKSLDPLRLMGSHKVVQFASEKKRSRFSRLSQYIFVPDNKIGWYPYAVRRGKALLKSRPFDLIFSSAPPYTAHVIASSLGAWSGLPVVLDYRDDWLDNPRHIYPGAMYRRLNLRLERKAIRCSNHVFTINEAIRSALLSRHRHITSQLHTSVLPQGFDPQDFSGHTPAGDRKRMRMLYSGIFYDAQTPDYLLKAIARLIEQKPGIRKNIELAFTGMVPGESVELIERLGIVDVVTLSGNVPHNEAVKALMESDILWMTVGQRQGAESISTGKLFEYFGSKKPILALVPEGAARTAVTDYGASVVVAPDDVEAICDAVFNLYVAWKEDRLPEPDLEFINLFDRREIAATAARVFSSILHEA